MDVLVLAGGGISTTDPLYPIAGGQPKSMMHIAGKPMAQWVLDALSDSALVNTIAVIGLNNSVNLTCSKELHFLPDAGTLLQNIQSGAAHFAATNPSESHILTVSADIPAVTSSIIDQCIRTYCEIEFDVFYSVVDKETMEKRYPESKRTYVKLKDGQVCGGDVNCVKKQAAMEPDGAWGELIRNRKNPVKQASLIGWGTLFGLLTGTLILDDAADRVCRKLGIRGKVIKMPYAEIGMDVDKPFQHKIVEQDLLR